MKLYGAKQRRNPYAPAVTRRKDIDRISSANVFPEG